MISIFSQLSCKSQNSRSESQSDRELINRRPVVAGQFYPGNEKDMEKMLKGFFEEAPAKQNKDQTVAVISPHAGYVFSGKVAAASYKQVDPDKDYKNIFIIGSSHRTMFSGASIYNIGNYITPLGEVPVNKSLANRLIKSYDVFSFNGNAHMGEHSLEVQIPFLQYWLNKDFSIIPVVIGSQDVKTPEKIAKALKPYFTDENLFVISTDFSHYPRQKVAVEVDNKSADAVISNSTENLINTIREQEAKGAKNLATCMCGLTSVLSLMFITENDKNITYNKIKYMNSGDTPYGDSQQVVGYYAISVTTKIPQKNNRDFFLDEKDKSDLIGVARNTVDTYVKRGKIADIDDEEFSSRLHALAGAFVTLNSEDGKLRGCIGQFNAKKPLYEVVSEMAIAASSKDSRFQPVSKSELKDLVVEISVLTPMKKIETLDEIILGKHGIYIVKNGQSGTFLPQVAEGRDWTKEEFLGYCSRDKARIGWTGWKNADIYIYEAIVFSEKEMTGRK